ncbi:hypothetical protein METP3_00568 [Methanosarcinales archaeon]|nr:hypothetical protein METP3_00568 [Methanosarcinales archaeon]
MYGLFNIPYSVKSSEQKEYRNYMCTLCDSLHTDYGVKGRLLTNYDSTTLALLIGALDKSLKKQIPASPRVLCLRPLTHKKSPDKFKFVSAVSIMIAYSRALDETIENGKKMPYWMSRSSEKASNYLSIYGLDKSFFENKLQEQHRLEKECNTIEALSAPSSEILSRIFGAIGELTDQTVYSSNLEKLGFELGKLIYVYDGLLDFQKDSKAGIFNCLSACYLNQDKDIRRISIEIFDFIENTRKNISSVLKNIEFENNDNLIKRIFLQDFEIKEINNNHNILYIFKGMKSTCGTRITLSKQTIYDIITGNLPMKFVQDERAQFDNLICDLCILVICFGCCCGGRWLDKKGKKDLKEYKDYLNSASEKEVLIEILKKQNRK